MTCIIAQVFYFITPALRCIGGHRLQSTLSAIRSALCVLRSERAGRELPAILREERRRRGAIGRVVGPAERIQGCLDCLHLTLHIGNRCGLSGDQQYPQRELCLQRWHRDRQREIADHQYAMEGQRYTRG